jgi:hypothetical protein
MNLPAKAAKRADEKDSVAASAAETGFFAFRALCGR